MRLDNFLSFQGPVVIENIAPISAFVGPNNSGKSNLIRVLEFYHKLSIKSKVAEYPSTDNIKGLQHRLAPNDPLFIEIKYRHENKNRSNDSLEITHSVSFNEKGEYSRERLWFKRLNDKVDRIHEIEIFKVEKNGDEYMTYLQNLESVNAFLSTSHSAKTPSLERSNLRSNKPFGWDWAKLDNPGMKIYGKLINAIQRWKFILANRARNSSEQFLYNQLGRERVETNALIDLIGNLTVTHDINFEQENGKTYALVGDLSSKKARFRLDQLGSGYEQIFLLLPEIYQGYLDDTLFFIDEPEVHLHPHFQRRLLQYLIQRSTNNQFLMATHSTIFCRQQDGLLQPYLVKKENDRTQIEIIGKQKMEDIKSILGHVNTDLFGYNAALFVEGYAEENALPLLAKNLGFDMVDYGIRILNSEGYG
ncbi:MAG: AAA family ATPase, partial [Nitrososphaeraceae archaeon]